ncbi:unnamed protein product [Allacma fusca]|uniref:HTH CENPB-type domain-containing protein n=1 Tax=Allacma fusca TaxID=39272 RepID=A0A8J2KDA3_9HEXA|nr:unnamed protein product [Allacma fusca]
MKWPESLIPESITSGSFKPIFSEEQEEVIVAYAMQLSERFYGLTRQALGEIAYRLAQQNGIVHPFTNGCAGEDWILQFLIRHPGVCFRQGTPTSLIRIQSFTKSAVYRFFDQLESVIAANNFTDSTIFNADETGISLVANRSPPRLARKGVRSVPVMVPAERGTLVTFTCCFSASGQYIPPLFVFPQGGKLERIRNYPAGSIFQKSKRGWSTSQTFLAWLKHFRTHAAPSRSTKVLLILDNHSSHVCYDAVMYASKNNIEILTIPPHCTHKLQPLDVSFFGPLKSKYKGALTAWLAVNEGRMIKNEDITDVVKAPFEQSCTEIIAVNGFKKTGLWVNERHGPDRFVFADEEFSPEIENVQQDQENNVDNNSDNGSDRGGENRDFLLDQNENPSELSAGGDLFENSNPEPESSQQAYSQDEETFVYDSVESFSETPAETDENENDTVPINDAPMDILTKIQKFQSLVPYALSDSDDDVNIPDDQDIQVASTSSNQSVNLKPFAVSPWDICKQNQTTVVPEVPSRKKRQRGSSELITSTENVRKIKEKHDKKSLKDTSSSDEYRVTRSVTKSSKRKLRSHSD